ncbi:hypothetical protein DL98DRAFT_303193 [Cadophora sp. DSE1049]|nr:hypothetical protein DL98DRAFT_303193 [Cadophora sp. DSE1049]
MKLLLLRCTIKTISWTLLCGSFQCQPPLVGNGPPQKILCELGNPTNNPLHDTPKNSRPPESASVGGRLFSQLDFKPILPYS